jgi:hypothetical protein
MCVFFLEEAHHDSTLFFPWLPLVLFLWMGHTALVQSQQGGKKQIICCFALFQDKTSGPEKTRETTNLPEGFGECHPLCKLCIIPRLKEASFFSRVLRDRRHVLATRISGSMNATSCNDVECYAKDDFSSDRKEPLAAPTEQNRSDPIVGIHAIALCKRMKWSFCFDPLNKARITKSNTSSFQSSRQCKRIFTLPCRTKHTCVQCLTCRRSDERIVRSSVLQELLVIIVLIVFGIVSEKIQRVQSTNQRLRCPSRSQSCKPDLGLRPFS